ncbi:MAG: hypothetical protein AAF890_03445 [Pseudomonadota bacterium]
MTLVPIPSGVRFTAFTPQLLVSKAVARMAGRRTESQQDAMPYWRLTDARTELLTPEQAGAMDAWRLQVSGGSGAFLVHDVLRPRPFYAGRVALSSQQGGEATIGSIATSTSAVLIGLPIGFQLIVGDKVGFKMTEETRSLHVLTANVTATDDGSGDGTATISFHPPLSQPTITTSAIAVFEKPSVPMELVGDWSLPHERSNRRASFSAVEVFL